MAKIPVYYTGPWPSSPGMPPCATCVILYTGTLNHQPEWQEWVKESHEKAEASGASFCQIDCPEPDGALPQIQPAVTSAPSLYFPNMVMPVCWSHIIGYRYTTKEEREAGHRSPLIQGKDYGVGFKG